MTPWKRKEVIGDATLYLGDCLEILPHLPKVDAVITDPPYGVGIAYGDNYDDGRSDYWEWLRERIACIRRVCPLLIFTHRVAALREITDWDWVGVWNKPLSMGSRVGNSCVLPHWEPIFMYGIHGTGTKSAYLNDVITCNPEPSGSPLRKMGRDWHEMESTGRHPCPKPVALYEKFINGFGQGDGIICDSFSGSGTTGVACMNLGRKFIGIEIEPKYFDIAVERITNAQRQVRLFA